MNKRHYKTRTLKKHLITKFNNSYNNIFNNVFKIFIINFNELYNYNSFII